MTFIEYRDAAFKAALELGCSAAEVYFMDEEVFSVDVVNADLENYSVEHGCGLNLRVKLDGKDGYAYTEVLDDPATLVRRAMDNARSIESEDVHPMQGRCEYPQVTMPQNPAKGMTAEDKIKYAMDIERATLAADPRVRRMDRSTVSTSRVTTRIHNTLGMEADSIKETAVAISDTILGQDGVEKGGWAIRFGRNFFDMEGMVNEAVQAAADQFNASPVPSGEYSVILRNDAAGDLLGAFFSVFSAEAAQKGLSLLKGKEGENIASDAVSIVDDPFYPDNPRAFDAEGVPSVRTEVVSHGRLNTLLHNLKTAAVAGCESTSNAGRSGGVINVSPSNFYIEAGEKSLDELTQAMGDGLIITDLAGLHSGLNAVSGDFSLLARGFLVKGGKRVRSVEQITIAGNLLPLLRGIIAVGSDLRFFGLGSGIGSPSLLVDRIMISG